MEPLSPPIRAVRRLAGAAQIEAVKRAEAAVDDYVAGFRERGDRVIALDILLRNLARPRLRNPLLGALLDRLEAHIDHLHRGLARGAA
jgi:hypothetical protein